MFHKGKLAAVAAALTITSLFSADLAMAGDFRAVNGVRAGSIDDQTFEIIDGRIHISIWCAAGDYARRKLKEPWKNRLYVIDQGPSQTTNRRYAVQFTTDPGAAGVVPSGSGVSNFDLNPGANLTVTQAFGNCDDQSILSIRN